MFHTGDINSDYIFPSLHKLSKESSKQIIVLGDFDIHLLNCKSSELVKNILDTLSSHFLSPHIILPTRISSSSTLIDSIISNLIHTTKIISGNLISTVSDLPAHILILLIFSNTTPSKYNIYRHTTLVLDKENINEISDNYLHNLNTLLEKHAP